MPVQRWKKRPKSTGCLTLSHPPDIVRKCLSASAKVCRFALFGFQKWQPFCLGSLAEGRILRLKTFAFAMLIRILSLISIWLLAMGTAAGQPFTAEELFQHALKMDSQSRLTEANVYYDMALEKDPNHDRARHNRAMVNLRLHRWKNAADDLDKLLDEAPYDRDLLEYRAQTAIERAEFALAEHFLNRAITVADTASRTRITLGAVHLSLKKPRQALEDYEAALRFGDANISALAGMGAAYLDQNDPENAADCLQKAIEKGGGDLRLWHDMGVALSQMGDYPGAIEQFNRILQNADALDALACRAFCHFRLGDFAQARLDALTAQTDETRPPEAYLTEGLLLLREHDFEQAEDVFSDGLFWSPENPDLLAGRGYALYRLGRLDEALDDLDEALSQRPNNGEARFARACAQFGRGQRRRACEDYRAAVAVGYQPYADDDGALPFCETPAPGGG